MNTATIKQLIEDTLRILGVNFEEVTISEVAEGQPLSFLIKSSDSGVLIGNKGTHLSALNHLVKKMAVKKLGEEAGHFFIDVNNYQEKSIEELRAKIKIFSDRAKSFGVDVELPPMSAYERMLVHSYLANDPLLKTESAGEGKNRHVVIKYIRPGAF